MAKLSFTKLNKIKSLPEKVVDFQGNELRVKPYLPLSDKLQLLINVLELSGADEGYFNLVQLEVFYKIEVIRNYTNISFTDTQLKDFAKLYDQIVLNGVWDAVADIIPEEELDYVWDAIYNMAEAITAYNRSLAGMLKTLSEDYSVLDTEATKIQKTLASPEVVSVMKQFLPEVGLSN